MKLTSTAALLGALALTFATTAHAADVVVTGGNGKADCYTGLDVSPDGPILKQTPASIMAGACGGKCTFTVKACVGLSAPTKCTPAALSSLTSVPTLGNPDTLGPANACGAEQAITVTLSGKKKIAKSKVKLTATATSAKPKKDKDNIKLICKSNGDQGCPNCVGAACGCPSTCANSKGGPNRLTLKIANSGTDLDNGWKGASHNFPLVPNGSLDMCLDNCDGTSDTLCDACGKVGVGTTNTDTFGAPLPLLASGTAVCVVSRWRDDIHGTVDEATGDTTLKVLLNSEVYLTDQSAICPQCKGGQCDSASRNPGAACTVDAPDFPVFISSVRTDKYQLSSKCQPPSPVATLQITFDPLTSGESSKLKWNFTNPADSPCGDGLTHPKVNDCPAGGCGAGNCTGLACVTMADDPTNPGHQICIDSKGGLSQACCVNQTSKPCFLPDANGDLFRTGKPNPPTPPLPDQTYPKQQTGVLASTFCIPATGTGTIDSVTGLPGAGTILLNGTGQWTK